VLVKAVEAGRGEERITHGVLLTKARFHSGLPVPRPPLIEDNVDAMAVGAVGLG